MTDLYSRAEELRQHATFLNQAYHLTQKEIYAEKLRQLLEALIAAPPADGQLFASNFTARQQAPEIYDMNASLYAYSPEFLKSGKGVLDGYCECIEMYDTGVLDLDHEIDFELMEVIA